MTQNTKKNFKNNNAKNKGAKNERKKFPNDGTLVGTDDLDSISLGEVVAYGEETDSCEL